MLVWLINLYWKSIWGYTIHWENYDYTITCIPVILGRVWFHWDSHRENVWRGPAQDVQFLHALLFECTKKLQVKNSNQFFNKFHIKRADDTIQSLDYVVGQMILSFSTVVYLTDLQSCSFWFLVFFQKCRFLFLHLKRAHKFVGNLIWGLKQLGTTIFQHPSKSHKLILFKTGSLETPP